MNVPTSRRKAFTLIELLVALAILSTAMAIVFLTFTSTIRAWTKGSEMLDDLHHGEFVMEQLVTAMRSTAYFYTRPDKYGFRLKRNAGGGPYESDRISWVTSGTAFIPNNSPLAEGLHRLVISIENDDEGEPAVAIRAKPPLSDEDDDEGEPWFVSGVVKGIKCRTYDFEDEVWEREWEDTNSVPKLVEITLYMDPLEEFEDPVTIKRLIEIPVAPDIEEDEEDRGAPGDAGVEGAR